MDTIIEETFDDIQKSLEKKSYTKLDIEKDKNKLVKINNFKKLLENRFQDEDSTENLELVLQEVRDTIRSLHSEGTKGLLNLWDRDAIIDTIEYLTPIIEANADTTSLKFILESQANVIGNNILGHAQDRETVREILILLKKIFTVNIEDQVVLNKITDFKDLLEGTFKDQNPIEKFLDKIANVIKNDDIKEYLDIEQVIILSIEYATPIINDATSLDELLDTHINAKNIMNKHIENENDNRGMREGHELYCDDTITTPQLSVTIPEGTGEGDTPLTGSPSDSNDDQPQGS